MKKGQFFQWGKITKGIVWIKILKKESFKKRSNEFNWDE